MTIAFGAIGAKSTGGTTTTAVAYPTPVSAGDFLILADCGWPSSAGVNAIGGWSVTQLAGGTGIAVDDHTTTVAAFRKEAAGGETGTVTVTRGGTPTGQLGVMARYTRTGPAWQTAATATGTDNTHGADRSITTGTVDLAPGDMVVLAVAVDTDTALTITSPTLTASGITFGTVNRRTSGVGDVVGEDGNIELFDALVVSGTGTVAVTFAFTTATTQCGPVVLTRLREVPPLPPQSLRDRLTVPLRRRSFTGRPATTTVTVTAQALPPQAGRDRLFWFPRSRPRQAQPVPTQVVVTTTQALPPQSVRDRLFPQLRRRPFRTTVTVTAVQLPPQPLRDRLMVVPRRRTFVAQPLPVVVVTATTQALPPQPAIRRPRLNPPPRRRAAAPPLSTAVVVTVQALPPQPARRRLGLLPRVKARTSSPVPAQVVAQATLLPAQPSRRRPGTRLRARARTAAPPLSVQVVVTSQAPVPATRRRHRFLPPLRRGESVQPTWVTVTVIPPTTSTPPERTFYVAAEGRVAYESRETRSAFTPDESRTWFTAPDLRTDTVARDSRTDYA